mmetsp:Transcript_14765/g.28422  ORF Transcript_14765/g.28422 Transcript_14765/m.28422 type:complete len:226 (+) Transcript_14765:1155-1832(+)
MPDVAEVVHGDDVVLGHMAELRHLLLGGVVQRLLTPTRQEVRHQPRGAQHLHAVLGGLGFLFTHHSQNRNQAHVDEAKVVLADAPLELAQRLDERHALNVSHGASQLNDAHVGNARVAVHGDVRDALDPVLDGVRDVRHHLHRLPQVIPAPLPLNHVLIDLASGDVVVLGQLHIQKALVIPQVQVHLATVVKHKHFAVLEWRHRPCICVDVWIYLDCSYTKTRSL